MDDLELDREVQAALAVVPSPDFLARVRTRIADAPAPSVIAGLMKPAALAVCVGVIAVVVSLGEDARLKPSPTEAVPSPTPIARSAEPATTGLPTFDKATLGPPKRGGRKDGKASTIAASTKVHRSPRPARTPAARTPEPPLPEVMIAAGDIKALREFLAAANEVRFVASFDVTPAPTPWTVPETVDHNN